MTLKGDSLVKMLNVKRSFKILNEEKSFSLVKLILKKKTKQKQTIVKILNFSGGKR